MLFFRKHLSTKCDNGRLRFAIPGYDNDEVEQRRETVRLGSSIAWQVNKPSCRWLAETTQNLGEKKELSPINLSLRHRSSMNHVAHVGRFLSRTALHSPGKSERRLFFMYCEWTFIFIARDKTISAEMTKTSEIALIWAHLNVMREEKGETVWLEYALKAAKFDAIFNTRHTKSISRFFEVCSLFEKRKKISQEVPSIRASVQMTPNCASVAWKNLLRSFGSLMTLIFTAEDFIFSSRLFTLNF